MYLDDKLVFEDSSLSLFLLLILHLFPSSSYQLENVERKLFSSMIFPTRIQRRDLCQM